MLLLYNYLGYQLILQLDSCEGWSKIMLNQNKMYNVASAIQPISKSIVTLTVSGYGFSKHLGIFNFHGVSLCMYLLQLLNLVYKWEMYFMSIKLGFIGRQNKFYLSFDNAIRLKTVINYFYLGVILH